MYADWSCWAPVTQRVYVMAMVLVVDNLRCNRDRVCAALRHIGHDTLEACGGIAAIEVLAAHRADLMITDVRMTGLDGYQLARSIRSDPSTAATPIIFYTSDSLAGGSAVSASGRWPDAWPTVGKPGNIEDLIEAVEDALSAGAHRPLHMVEVAKRSRSLSRWYESAIVKRLHNRTVT